MDRHEHVASADKDIMEHNKARKDEKAFEILSCMICSRKPNNAHMCPHCSKFSCEQCIKEWLEARRSECPACRKPLRSHELVNCSQLARELTETIEKLTKREPQDQQCRKHRVKMQYYCKNCRQPICSDCAMIGAEHKGHEFDKLTNITAKYEQQLRNQLTLLGLKKKAFNSSFESIKQQIEQLNLIKQSKNSELQKFTNNLIERIDKKHVGVSSIYQQQQSEVQSKLEILQELFQNVNRKINSYSKAKFLLQQENLRKEVARIAVDPITEDRPIRTNNKIVSQLVPTYDKKTFILHRYSQLRKSKEVVYTDVFISRGLEWRLKIYPNGTENSQNVYISIFVQLSKNIQEVGKYKYKIEIINQKNSSMKISREFDSQFELGQCWGYNTYAKISSLYQQGYVHPEEDYLQIVLNIKSPTFYHQVIDQNKLIENQRLIHEKNSIKIRELKHMLSMSSPRVVHTEQSSTPNQIIKTESRDSRLLELDEICQVKQAMTLEDSPKINDDQIYSPVIRSDKWMEPRHEEMRSVRTHRIKNSVQFH